MDSDALHDGRDNAGEAATQKGRKGKFTGECEVDRMRRDDFDGRWSLSIEGNSSRAQVEGLGLA